MYLPIHSASFLPTVVLTSLDLISLSTIMPPATVTIVLINIYLPIHSASFLPTVVLTILDLISLSTTMPPATVTIVIRTSGNADIRPICVVKDITMFKHLQSLLLETHGCQLLRDSLCWHNANCRDYQEQSK